MSRIEWVRNNDGTQGYTINPVKGLCPVDCKDNQGKSYCYARRSYKRFKWQEKIRWHPPAWDLVDTLKTPSRIFVGSTFELFLDSLPDNWMEYNLLSAKKYPQHTFIFLTKQPQNLARWSPFPPNCWVGITCDTKKRMIDGYHHLCNIKATIKFISFEPLLECMDINSLSSINWVIIGQQTPTSTKTAPIAWVQEIVEAADKAGVKVFLKGNLKALIQEAGMGKCGWASREWVQCKYPVLRQEMPVV